MSKRGMEIVSELHRGADRVQMTCRIVHLPTALEWLDGGILHHRNHCAQCACMVQVTIHKFCHHPPHHQRSRYLHLMTRKRFAAQAAGLGPTHHLQNCQQNQAVIGPPRYGSVFCPLADILRYRIKFLFSSRINHWA